MANNPTGKNQYSGGVRSAYKNLNFHGGYSAVRVSKSNRMGLARAIKQMRSGASPINLSQLGMAKISTYKRNLSRVKAR